MLNDVTAEEPRRAVPLQQFLEEFRRTYDIPDWYVEASGHRYLCRCNLCLKWWAESGPDGDDPYAAYAWGPFTIDEIEEYRRNEHPG